MSWRDDYQQGSFRGVPFRTEFHERAGGRRVASFEFPGRDEPLTEDLGRRQRIFSIDCHVIGDDYFGDRDAMIDALEAEGPGLLIHPWYGQLMVVVNDFRTSENTEEGRMARFTIDFAEGGAPVSAPIGVPTGQLTSIEAGALRNALPGEFASRFSIEGAIGFVEDAAGDLIGGIADISQIAAGLQGGVGPALRAFEAGLRYLPGNVASLMSAPVNLARSVVGLVVAVSALGSSGRSTTATRSTPLGYHPISSSTGIAIAPSTPQVVSQAATKVRVAALSRMLDWDPPEPIVPAMTASRKLQVGNHRALTWLFHTATACELARLTAEAPYASYEDAVATRDAVAGRLDRLATRAADRGDDVAAEGFDRLRLAMVRDITVRGATLARIYAVEQKSTEPMLAIANRAYGPLGVGDRAEEIVARNRIAHPGFVPAGRTLQLLTLTEARGS